MRKTNKGLVEYAKAQMGLPYWYGTFGQTATAELYKTKKNQYPQYYRSWNDFPTQYGKRVHDCVGLIKGYLWSDNSTSKPVYNTTQDVSANGMRSKCTEKGNINTMPDIPGVLVFMDGHVGVYIGGGEVIEARGHEYGVVKTKFSERPWKWWGKCPWLEYESGCGSVKIKPGTWYVRKGAGTNYKDICIVSGGTGEVFISGKTAENGWRYLDKFGGWISSKAIVQI